MFKQFAVAAGLSAMIVVSGSYALSAAGRAGDKFAATKQPNAAVELHQIGFGESVGGRSKPSI
jgi:hypothetical protein